ncbi:hypothetical protein JSY14_01260 [Brachybacterium sp. EF45031]|uniref:hypothetical protein n=1 Tax=Brachybacterium sillae TaxID=2810536 RepID=UPI00217E5C9E|nr:hypothetical protein [Brachybacterium sillae]MCS6710714.1 hypothetical protein [Brachybacterium sillae]
MTPDTTAPTGHRPSWDAPERTVLPDGTPVVTLRAHSATDVERLAALGALVQRLRGRGCAVAPQVLAEGDGWLRVEAGRPTPPSRPGAGRRRAEPADGGMADPATAERLAIRDLREELTTLIDALHAEGWVLGQPSGSGLAARPDGTAILADLAGLRRTDDPSAQAADHRWIDQTCGDPGHTLRRRMLQPLDEAPSSGGTDPLDELFQETATRRRDLAGSEGFSRAGAGAGAGVPLVGGSASPLWPPVETTAAVQPAGERAAASEELQDALPRAARPGEDPRRRAVARARRAGAALAALGAVVMAAAVVVPGLREAPVEAMTAAPSATASPAAQESQATTGPQLTQEEAPAVVSGLVADRKRYLLGESETGAALPGSEAEAEDRTLREVYRDAQVEGWRTDVESVRVLTAQPGRAEVAAVLTETAHTVTIGERRERREAVPAHEVRLLLVHDGAQWRVSQVRPGD